MVETGSGDAMVSNEAKPFTLIAFVIVSESMALLIWSHDSSLVLNKQSDFVHSDGSN
jgi:hypothetical protein